MSLDAVKRVMEVEKQASQQREEGEREARRRITAAEKAGAERLESACRAAEIKVKKMMTEEEEKNAKETAERQEEAARLYEEIKAEGERHLDQAAEWTGRTAKHAGMGQLAASGFHSASDGEKSSHYGSDRLGECKPIRSSSVRTVHSTGGHPGTGFFPAGNDGRGLGAGGKDQCLEPAAGKAPDPGDQSEELENQFDAVGPAGPSS